MKSASVPGPLVLSVHAYRDESGGNTFWLQSARTLGTERSAQGNSERVWQETPPVSAPLAHVIFGGVADLAMPTLSKRRDAKMADLCAMAQACIARTLRSKE